MVYNEVKDVLTVATVAATYSRVLVFSINGGVVKNLLNVSAESVSLDGNILVVGHPDSGVYGNMI